MIAMRKKLFYLVGLICLLSFLTGCGTNNAGNGLVKHTLTVTRESTLRANLFPVFAKNIDDTASATRLYNAIKALPSAHGLYSCPSDNGLRYKLDFSLNGAPAQQITVSGSGCRMISLSESEARMTNNAFWSLFAQVTGLSESDLFPHPLPN